LDSKNNFENMPDITMPTIQYNEPKKIYGESKCSYFEDE
jgi:hypothetical protein